MDRLSDTIFSCVSAIAEFTSWSDNSNNSYCWIWAFLPIVCYNTTIFTYIWESTTWCDISNFWIQRMWTFLPNMANKAPISAGYTRTVNLRVSPFFFPTATLPAIGIVIFFLIWTILFNMSKKNNLSNLHENSQYLNVPTLFSSLDIANTSCSYFFLYPSSILQ